MRHILTGRVRPVAIFYNTPSDGAASPGAGATPPADPPPKDDKGGAAKPPKEGDGAAPPPAEKPPADDGKGKAPAKKKKDGLLEVLSGGAAEKPPEGGAGKPDPTETEKADAARREAEVAEATKGLSQKAAENFRTVAAARDAAEQRANDLQKQLDTIKTQQPQIPPEVQTKLAKFEALQQEHNSLLEMVEKIGAERSPTYQKKFVQGRANLIGKAAGLVKKYGGDEGQFKAALELQGRERSDALQTAMADMHALDQQRVAAVLTEVESLEEEGASFLGNAKESLLKEEQEAQQIESQRMREMVQQREAGFTEVANKMLHKLPDDHELAAETNPIVDKAIEKARQFLFEGKDFAEFAQASIAYAMFPVMQEKLLAAANTIAELESKLEEYTAADPGNGGSGGGGGGGAATETKGFTERFKGAMSGGAAA
jgi:hypothetical protein